MPRYANYGGDSPLSEFTRRDAEAVPEGPDLLTGQGTLPSNLSSLPTDTGSYDALSGLATNYSQGPLADAVRASMADRQRSITDAATVPGRGIRGLLAGGGGAGTQAGSMLAGAAFGDASRMDAGKRAAIANLFGAGTSYDELAGRDADILSGVRDMQQRHAEGAFDTRRKLAAGADLEEAARRTYIDG